jgi:hypothetical protein
MATKKTSFFQKVATGVTGRTPEQRKMDTMLKAKVKAKQMAYFQEERMKQAETVGRARAKFQARQQIQAIGKPKPLIDIGDFGKVQAGFDPMSFGMPTGKKKKGKKVPSVSDYLKSIPK